MSSAATARRRCAASGSRALQALRPFYAALARGQGANYDGVPWTVAGAPGVPDLVHLLWGAVSRGRHGVLWQDFAALVAALDAELLLPSRSDAGGPTGRAVAEQLWSEESTGGPMGTDPFRELWTRFVRRFAFQLCASHYRQFLRQLLRRVGAAAEVQEQAKAICAAVKRPPGGVRAPRAPQEEEEEEEEEEEDSEAGDSDEEEEDDGAPVAHRVSSRNEAYERFCAYRAAVRRQSAGELKPFEAPPEVAPETRDWLEQLARRRPGSAVRPRPGSARPISASTRKARPRTAGGRKKGKRRSLVPRVARLSRPGPPALASAAPTPPLATVQHGRVVRRRQTLPSLVAAPQPEPVERVIVARAWNPSGGGAVGAVGALGSVGSDTRRVVQRRRRTVNVTAAAAAAAEGDDGSAVVEAALRALGLA